MKKSKVLSILALASSFVMAGCGEETKPDCSHVDDNKDHLCDLCNEKLSEHEAAAEWKHDEHEHWHECSFEGCDVVLNKAAHSFSEWSVVTPATFEAEGLEKRVCACGYEETRPIAKLGHNFSSDWSKDAEKHWHKCVDEGYENLRSDEAIHSFGEWSTKSPADFEHKEVLHRTCSVCNYEETKEVGEVVPHNYSSEWSKDNNTHWHACTDEGYTDLKKDVAVHADANADHLCDVCGQKMTEHSFGEGWLNDETNHWHECEFEGCDEVSGLEAHVDANADHKCDDCEYVMSEHSFSEGWSNDATNHWHECEFEGCDEVSGLEAHVDNNKDHLCDVCEYVMSEHDFESTWSHANGQHFHECSFEGCDDISDVANHIDEDFDGYCDVCTEIMPAVNSITLDYLTGYIGAGESVLLTADVSVTGDAPKDVEWHLEKSNGSSWTSYSKYSVTDIFTLVDNKDGTATLSGVMKEYIAEFSCYVYATSKFDDSVSSNKTEKIYYQTWNNTKRGTLNSLFGDGKWQTIPFFPSTSLTLNTAKTELTGKSTSRKIAQMIASFDNQGTWTKVSASDTTATYTLSDGYINYECVISQNTSSTSYGQFVITKSLSLPEEFLGTFSFVAHDDFGNVDMPVLVDVTNDGATFIAYASDGIYSHKCAFVGGSNGVISFSQGTSYSDLTFTLESNDGLVYITGIYGSWFDGYTWSATLPSVLSTDDLRIVVADDSIQNGSVTVTSDAGTLLAPIGATVEFQVTAAKGYEIDTVSLSESGVELKALYGGKYSFVMPDADVVISATFKAKEVVAFDWSTYVGSFDLNVVEYGMTATTITFTFDNMTVEYSDYPGYSYPCTADFNGCGSNQVHLTDPYGAFEIIIEESDGSFILAQQIA